jgi:hypothetical protein
MARPTGRCMSVNKRDSLAQEPRSPELNIRKSAEYLFDLVIGPLQIAEGFDKFRRVSALANQQVENGRITCLLELEHFLVDEAMVNFSFSKMQ